MLESESQIRTLKSNIIELEGVLVERKNLVESLEGQLEELRQELIISNKKLQDGETLRRKLHNLVQELKGNIRVFCRVRPFLPSELLPTTNNSGGGDGKEPKGNSTVTPEHILIGLNEDEQEEIKLLQSAETASGQQITKAYPFTFDKVFGFNSLQKEIFDEISQLVQSALDGYRVCIFAYGQTGSGKTFTMEGDSSNPDKAGMIPRAVEQIFESTKTLKEKGWKFSFEASFLEIYNESIRDLLTFKNDIITTNNNNTTNNSTTIATSNAGVEGKYDIKHVDGKTFVTDLTVQPVKEAVEIMSLLRRAATNRAVAETQCNERSSRSHRYFSFLKNRIILMAD